MSVIAAGVTPFGVLWLYKDHENHRLAYILNNTDDSVFQESVPFASERSYTFPLLITFRLLGFISSDAMATLIDVCGMTTCKNHDGDFARQKLWGKTKIALYLLFICSSFVLS